MKININFKVVLLATTAFILSLLTLVMGAPFLKTLRKATHPAAYWLTGIGFSFLVGPLWYFVAIPWICIGLETELELKGFTYMKACFYSLVTLTGLTALALWGLKFTGYDLKTQVTSVIDIMVDQLKKMSPEGQITADSFWQQLPSFYVGTLIVVLATAAAFERAVHSMFRLRYRLPLTRGNYFDFKIPSWAFWLSLVGLLLSMFEIKEAPWTTLVGLNLTNVFMILYFVQGAVISEYALRALRAGLLWRIFVYFVMMGPLALGIVVIGFVDFWLDFRLRIQKLLSLNLNNKT